MNPALMILGPVILISLLWIIAESQQKGGRLGQWYDEVFGKSRPEEGEVPGSDAALRAPGASRIYDWNRDLPLWAELTRSEIDALPEAAER